MTIESRPGFLGESETLGGCEEAELMSSLLHHHARGVIELSISARRSAASAV